MPVNYQTLPSCNDEFETGRNIVSVSVRNQERAGSGVNGGMA